MLRGSLLMTSGFVCPSPVRGLTRQIVSPLRPACTSSRKSTRMPLRRSAAPSMIQSPDMDGPPDLSAFFDQKARRVGRDGAPISVGTGRANLKAHGGDSAATAAEALRRALETIRNDGSAQICHCTMSLDVDARAVASELDAKLDKSVPIVGRSVNKKDSSGTVEVLLLRSDEASGISYAVSSSDGSGEVERMAEAAKAAATTATEAALAGLADPKSCTFLIYAHTPVAGSRAVRDGIDSVSPGITAYGGPAVGDEENGTGWTLMGVGGDGRETNATNSVQQQVCVAAVPGSINFLISSVVKNWAQPTFSEPLSYMTPTYVDNPTIDLLTAIRYDDWEKFIWCLEDQGVDVNVKWVEKQNQSPLLAACARCRTRMIEYMIAKGADVHHRNAGNFTAAMYTRKLTEYDRDVVLAQLKMLEDAGLQTTLSPEDEKAVRSSGDGRIFIDNVY